MRDPLEGQEITPERSLPEPERDPEKAESAAILEATDMATLGNPPEVIRKAIGKRYPTLDMGRILTVVREFFRSVAAEPVDVRMGWLTEALRELYRRQVLLADYSEARLTLAELVRLTKQPREKAGHPAADEGEAPAVNSGTSATIHDLAKWLPRPKQRRAQTPK